MSRESSEYNSLDGLVRSYFSNDSVIPSSGDSYYGESGAIKVANSEDYGLDYVLVSENFIDEHCGDDSRGVTQIGVWEPITTLLSGNWE